MERSDAEPRRAGNLAVVVPCYNEEDVLDETIGRLLDLLDELAAEDLVVASSHLCLVDDGSRDATWSIISRAAKADNRVRGLKLSRNYGHQNALLAGLLNVDADVVISIDADLQDDVSVVKEMLRHYHDGKDIVFGVRRKRESDSFLKRTLAEGFYRLLAAMGVDVVFNHADFRLMSRRAIIALSEFGEVNLFLRGVIPSIGFPQSQVTYDRAERAAGESKYSWRRMFSLAINGITSFSTLPLRLIALIGIIIFFATSLMSIWVLWTRFVAEDVVPGWASSVLPMYFLGGVQLLSIGVLGEYVGKIYAETKRRPRFLIEQRI